MKIGIKNVFIFVKKQYFSQKKCFFLLFLLHRTNLEHFLHAHILFSWRKCVSHTPNESVIYSYFRSFLTFLTRVLGGFLLSFGQNIFWGYLASPIDQFRPIKKKCQILPIFAQTPPLRQSQLSERNVRTLLVKSIKMSA